MGVPPKIASRRSHTIERKCCTSAIVGRLPCLLFAVPPNTTASSSVPLRTSADIAVLPFDFAASTRWNPSASQYVSPSVNTVTSGNCAPSAIASA